MYIRQMNETGTCPREGRGLENQVDTEGDDFI